MTENEQNRRDEISLLASKYLGEATLKHWHKIPTEIRKKILESAAELAVLADLNNEIVN